MNLRLEIKIYSSENGLYTFLKLGIKIIVNPPNNANVSLGLNQPEPMPAGLTSPNLTQPNLS